MQISILAILVLALIMPCDSKAIVINGGFETGDFTGWTLTPAGYFPEYGIGSNEVVQSSYGVKPTGGIYQGLLTNGPGNSFSSTGSAMRQTITATANDRISFDWNFFTNEIPFIAPPSDDSENAFNDTALFRILNLDSPSLSQTFVLAEAKKFLRAPSETEFKWESGYQHFDYVLAAAGNYELLFEVYDVCDQEVNSGLLIDRVEQGRSTSVPEPTTLIMYLIGLVSFSIYKAARRRA